MQVGISLRAKGTICVCWKEFACSFVFFATVAELGDYEEETAKKHLEQNQYLPNQEYLDNKILKYYQRHV